MTRLLGLATDRYRLYDNDDDDYNDDDDNSKTARKLASKDCPKALARFMPMESLYSPSSHLPHIHPTCHIFFATY